ncbi:hypothetical protein BJ875DRAFT_451557 [Amylocarpus encephaloides]|uniref:Uncharacterized protein n=1 Tax=Amylocarpus encephaloides TaxID=45428 RepID=A0A9P7YR91_9HELO|nr:hypothetical protein BJ875DRAFT_451557 [Amylocarpus encephaloides]
MQSEITSQIANPNFGRFAILHETPDAARILKTLPNPDLLPHDIVEDNAHFPPYRFYRRSPPHVEDEPEPEPVDSTRSSLQTTFSMSSMGVNPSHKNLHAGNASTERDPCNSRVDSSNHRRAHRYSYSIENFLVMSDRDVFENHHAATGLSRDISSSTFAPRALTITKTPPVQQEQFQPSVPNANRVTRRSDSGVLEDTQSLRLTSVDTSTKLGRLSLTPLLDRDCGSFAEKRARKTTRRAGQGLMSASTTSTFDVPASPTGSTDVEKLATAALACCSACKSFGYDLIYAVELSALRSNLTDAELLKASGLTMRVLVAHGMDEVPILDPKIHLSALRSRGCYNWVAPTPTHAAGFASAKFFAFGKESGLTKDRTDGIVFGALRRAGVAGAVGTSDAEETRDLREFVTALKGILPRSDRLPRASGVGSIRGR